ncbi:MAG TPA: GTP pyrophosphokinase [Bacteroidales bacterium]|nr:GTP pyrophosphokinase [Bacteroidales bacterium]
MVIFNESVSLLAEAAYANLVESCPKCQLSEDLQLLRQAYEYAYKAHLGSYRASGEPFILHPIAVAKICVTEMGLGANSAVSALLHDVLETDGYTIEDIQAKFGTKIAYIIDGLTKLPKEIVTESNEQAENFRKLLLTLSDDVRVVLIKLAARLHNIRTLEPLDTGTKIKTAGEILEMYAPLAHRLGLNAIKTEMEDLSFKYLNPDAYFDLKNKIEADKGNRKELISLFTNPIKEALERKGYKYNIKGRTKSVYSVWQKMQRKNVPFDEVFDLFAIRIVFEPKVDVSEKVQSFEIYSIVTELYTASTSRTRDWVTHPKENGYEALHATVLASGGDWVEVQIRSKRMDEIAERGYAAHWKYKGSDEKESGLDRWIRRTSEILSNPDANAIELLDDFKLNLFTSEIMVFTPKGKIVTLPKGATVLDFAFEIHTQLGLNCIGAQINSKLVGPEKELQTGDKIKILTSAKQQPEEAWLKFVITAKAKAYLKAALKISEFSIRAQGRKMLETLMVQMNVEADSKLFKKIITDLNIRSKEQLYDLLGKKLISEETVRKVITATNNGKFINYWRLQFRSNSPKALPSENDTYKVGFPYSIAKCCSPIPGDQVIGIKHDNGETVIHLSDCKKALSMATARPQTIVKPKWITDKLESFPAKIQLKGTDRPALINEITGLISNEWDVKMYSINFTVEGAFFDGSIGVYVHNIKDLNNLISDLSRLKGISSIHRSEMVQRAG